MNKQQAVYEHLMEIVDHFDERYGGLGEEIREFFSSSEELKKAIKEAQYDQNEKLISYIENDAPEELYEKAKKLHQEFFVDSSTLRIDLEREFFFGLAFRFEAFPEAFIQEMVKDGTLQKIFANSKEAFMAELEVHIQEIVSDNIENFLNALYHDYVPECVPEGLMEELSMILGEDIILIPATAIFPMNEELEDYTAE